MKTYFSQKTCLLFIFILFLTSCHNPSKPSLKVAATSVPHAEILEFIKPILNKEGIELDIIVIDDFNIPNRALADREIDANFFQHLPFLKTQQADFGYDLESLLAVHLEPMALYSKNYSSLNELQVGATIAIPNDPTNQGRALALCEQMGLIKLKNHDAKISLLDISDNPKNLHFIEMDSPLLSRALDDVDLAAITTNFALLAGLSPHKDALGIENAQSLFTNHVVIRRGESSRADLQALKSHLATDEVRLFMQTHYQGAVIPTF